MCIPLGGGKAPAVTAQKTAVPNEVSEEANSSRTAQKKRQAQARGFKSTLLSGELDQATTRKKTLLGGGIEL